VVVDGDEVLAIKASGQVTRSAASDVPAKGRDTMGVKFVSVNDDDTVVAIARNPEREVEDELLESVVNGDDQAGGPASAADSADADPKEDVAE
jgi:DNA gyrase subunit A